MTPNEKAKELVEKYKQMFGLIFTIHFIGSKHDLLHIKCKELALSCVDEILKLSHPNAIVFSRSLPSDSRNDIVIEEMTQEYYWQQVKEELKKL